MDEDATSPDHNSLQATEMKMREALGLGGGGSGPRRDSPPPRVVSEQPRMPTHRPMGDRPNGNGHRHRFVQDGEVPVVVVSHAGGASSPPANPRTPDPRAPNPRGMAQSAEYSAERAGRERAERQVQQAVAAIRDLETKLAHADIARMEATNGAKADRSMLMTVREELRAQVAQLREELARERAARAEIETRLRDVLAREPALERPRRGRPPGVIAATEGETAAAKPARKPRVAAADKPLRVNKRVAAEPRPVKWWVKRGVKG